MLITREYLCSLIDQGQQLSPYIPSDRVNQHFSQLYQLSINPETELDTSLISLSHPLMQQLQKQCSQAEFQMEQLWCQKLLDSSDPRTTIKAFPYWNNYLRLSQLEYHSLIAQNDQLKTMLFVGSGPLPLSAIVLAEKYGLHCTLIDRDESAVQLSQAIISKLSLQEKITVIQSDFLNFRTEDSYDAVLLAALLFNGSENDEALLAHLAKNISFDQCLIRSAEGSRQLLYQKVDEKLILKYFSPQILIHPQNEIVNSLFLCTPKPS